MSTLYNNHSRFGKHRKQTLVQGYINKNCNEWGLHIPIDVVNMFYIFFDDIFYWHLEGDEFEEFKSKPNTQCMISSLFNYNHHLFECGVFPNGRLLSQSNYVIFYISMPNISQFFDANDNIQQLTVYFQLFCEETQSQWKGIRVYINDNKKSAGWSAKTLPLQICKSFNSLWLSCYVQILHVKYKKTETLAITHNKYNNSKITYEWRIDKQLLNDVKNCNFGKTFFSNVFGGIDECEWILMMAPHLNTNSGIVPGKFFQCVFTCLRCIKLPKDMDSIKVEYLIECDSSNKKQDTMQCGDFSYVNNLSGWKNHEISAKAFDARSSMVISVVINFQ